MAIFDGNLPYTNFHELNLDWIIQKVHDLTVEYVKTQNEIKSVEEEFDNLKNYVDNYFAQTDFAQLAHDVLYEMLNNGDLATLFAQYTVRIYDNVASMTADTLLIEGSKAKTLGFYAKNDGGGAYYDIVSSSSNTDFYYPLTNGLYAHLVKEPILYMEKVGIQELTDVTNLLQMALNNYRRIKVPRGTYYTNGSLNVAFDETHLDLDGSTFSQTVNANGNFITCSGRNSFVLENGFLNYPTNPNESNSPICVSIYTSNHSKIKNMVISKPFGIGIGIENSINCLVQDTEVGYAQTHRAGIWIGSGSTYITLERVFSHHNDLDGLIADGAHQIVKDSLFTDNGTNPTVESGAIGACGIYVDSSRGDYSQYVNNSCERNTESGMDIRGRFIEIVSNRLFNNGLSGIIIRDFTWGATITDNICISNGNNNTTANPDVWGKSGINTQGRVQCVAISNNVCFSGTGTDQDYGIKLLPGVNNDVLIVGNVCSSNVLGGVDTTQSMSGNVQVANNIG